MFTFSLPNISYLCCWRKASMKSSDKYWNVLFWNTPSVLWWYWWCFKCNVSSQWNSKNFQLCPYKVFLWNSLWMNNVNNSSLGSISLDKSYNKILHLGWIDFVIRVGEGEVITRELNIWILSINQIRWFIFKIW